MDREMGIMDHKRACGKYKEGGFYLEADMSESGQLSAIASVAGHCHWDGVQLEVDLNPQAIMAFCPAASLMALEVVYVEDDIKSILSTDENRQRWQGLKTSMGGAVVGLLDHVGSSYYTPHVFTRETRAWGPSRKVPPDIAAQVAHVMPIPIFFAHSQIPMFENFADFNRWAAWSELFTTDPVRNGNLLPRHTDPVWHQPGWSMLVSGEDNGMGHWIHRILEFMDLVRVNEDHKSLYAEDSPQRRALTEARKALRSVEFSEQVWLASWLTRVRHIAYVDGSVHDAAQDPRITVTHPSELE